MTLNFREASGQIKALTFSIDTFSDDVPAAANVLGNNIALLTANIEAAVDSVNDATFWQMVCSIAKKFLRRSPRILTWGFGPDKIIDPKRGQQYLIGPDEKSIKSHLPHAKQKDADAEGKE